MSKSKYSQEYRESAVRLVLEEGLTASKVAKDLGIPSIYISQWKQEFLSSNSSALSEPKTVSEAQKRIKELEKQLKISEQEKEILKKAIGFFIKP